MPLLISRAGFAMFVGDAETGIRLTTRNGIASALSIIDNFPFMNPHNDPNCTKLLLQAHEFSLNLSPNLSKFAAEKL
jgi:hypothetical protein